jgi:hypothetical protein
MWTENVAIDWKSVEGNKGILSDLGACVPSKCNVVHCSFTGQYFAISLHYNEQYNSELQQPVHLKMDI